MDVFLLPTSIPPFPNEACGVGMTERERSKNPLCFKMRRTLVVSVTQVDA